MARMAPAGIGGSVEGIHAVAAAFAAGRVVELTVERSRLRHREIGPLVERARAAGIGVEVVESLAGLAVTTAPQGIVASARPIPTLDLAGVVARVDPAALVVLDHLQDPHNVGAVARSALAAGFGGMVLPARRSAPLEATVFKSAAGALERLAVCEVTSTADALTRLSRLGVWTVGLDASGDRSLFGLPLLSEPVAIVIGSEGKGLGRLVAERVDVVARIPLAGGVESLNASVAGALAVFETARRRGWV